MKTCTSDFRHINKNKCLAVTNIPNIYETSRSKYGITFQKKVHASLERFCFGHMLMLRMKPNLDDFITMPMITSC